MAGQLEDRAAIVTGGASGIGRATCLLFAREGAAIVVADVQDGAGEETAARIRGEGGRAKFVHTDTSDEAQVVDLVREASAAFGRLDAMVTAAGVSYAPGLGDDAGDPFQRPAAWLIVNKATERWRRVLDVNLTGVMLCAREAARQMIAEGHGGTIVTVASTAAYVPNASIADYCVAKAGVVMLTKCLAAELGQHGIRANGVAPGPIETGMTRDLIERGVFQQQAARLPLGRIGGADEVAQAILFLSGPQSRFVTGKTLGVDGGTYTI
ncbi:MAG: SDR family oxidoreductase [Dehalococcoidia bacterium]|nr:SDR family oxidoreductase [Dehalococcoidia bacterium]